MSSLTTLARPYAKAAFELANSDCNLAAWDDMLSAVAVITADEGMANWLQSPHSTAEKAVEIIVEAMGGEVDSRFHGYLGVLADNDRLSLCSEISRMFEYLRADAERRLQVRVVSAVGLQDSDIERMQSADFNLRVVGDLCPGCFQPAAVYALLSLAGGFQKACPRFFYLDDAVTQRPVNLQRAVRAEFGGNRFIIACLYPHIAGLFVGRVAGKCPSFDLDQTFCQDGNAVVSFLAYHHSIIS